MNRTELREALTDLFTRWHHGSEIARSRAEAVLAVVEQHTAAKRCILHDTACILRVPEEGA